MLRARGFAGLGLAIAGLVAWSSFSSCESVNLEGKACPCLTGSGYFCCAVQNICMREGQACVTPAQWPVSTAATGPPVPMDTATVYGFSQVDTNGASEGAIDDPQLLALAPDVVLRAWAQWGHYGVMPTDYQFSYVNRCHDAGIRTFMGGVTATVLLPDQISQVQSDVDKDPQDLTSRDAEDKMRVRIDADKNMIYRGTLANPVFRESLIAIGKIQIDGGVDGLHFEEVNGGYQGVTDQKSDGTWTADGNEGFDKFHLADFNAYLLAKNGRDADFRTLYGMTSDNMLRSDVPAWDLTRNFNYWKYLARNGWSLTPLGAGNPLAKEWGRTTVNRPKPGAMTFVDSAEPYLYWKEIVQQLRDYARASQGREIVISADGIYPFVDFQSVGLNDDNTDGPDGTAVHYLPLTDDGHLDGTKSLQAPFRRLKALSEQWAPGVPVVLFLDGPWKAYDHFTVASDREDFWRLYAAEAYANGLFFAFHLKSSLGKVNAEMTASQLGLMTLFTSLAGFYRAHADDYHGVVASTASATVSLAGAMVAVSDQISPGDHATVSRRLVHIVNHDYQPGTGIVPHLDVSVAIDSPSLPTSVTLAAPDSNADGVPDADVAVADFIYADGHVTVTVPLLYDYVVVALKY